jgi:hypothetical protein
MDCYKIEKYCYHTRLFDPLWALQQSASKMAGDDELVLWKLAAELKAKMEYPYFQMAGEIPQMVDASGQEVCVVS